MNKNREHRANNREPELVRNRISCGNDASGQGKQDNSLVLHRYSLGEQDNSLENLYDSLWNNVSEQGKQDNSLVLHRYSLGEQDNSFENLYDSPGNNASGQELLTSTPEAGGRNLKQTKQKIEPIFLVSPFGGTGRGQKIKNVFSIFPPLDRGIRGGTVANISKGSAYAT